MHRPFRVSLLLIAFTQFISCSTGRSIHGLELRSAQRPAVTIRVEPGFRYLGRFSFVLGSAFEGERYVFVDAEGKSLRRLFIVQFERVRRSSPEIYRYSFERGERIGSMLFIQNCFAFPGAQTIAADAHDEGTMTNNFLISRGFQNPPLWLAARFVTLGASDRKSEMIIFYMERNDHFALADLNAGDEPTPAWLQMKPEVLARARATFTLE